MQINVAKMDDTGRALQGEFTTYAFCGAIRGMGEADDALNRLTQADGVTHKLFVGATHVANPI